MTINQMLIVRQGLRLCLMISGLILLSFITADMTLANTTINTVLTTDLDATLHLIQFQPGTSVEMRQATITRMGGELVEWIDALDVAKVRIVEPQVTASSTDASIIHVETDTIVYGVGQVRGNSLEAPTFTDEMESYALNMIESPAAWAFTMGNEEVTIAVIDTGVNVDHPEFEGRTVAGYDFVNRDNDPMDDHGHGTHTAGIIAAGFNNGIGSAGVCPRCSIMPVKVLNSFNIGSWSNVASGILFAADNGAQVINMSLGAPVSSRIVERAIEYANEKGVLVIAAAGNSGTNEPFFPASLETVLAVSATTQSDELWASSNYGDYIDVAAPGESIFSAYHEDANGAPQFTHRSGTSMAAPHVAGLAGLLISQDSTRNGEDVRTLITENVDDLGQAGKDWQFGHGRINAQKALSANGATPLIVDEEFQLQVASVDNMTHQFFLPLVVSQ